MMSNYLAVATVTAALRDILQEAAVKAIPGAVVTTRRPEKIGGDGQDKAGINLFLYQVTPNAALSNADLQTRTANGLFLKRPQVALDLYYLLSFQGSDLDLQSQQLLGSAVITLHTQPILLPSIIRNTTQANTYLAQSDLFDQIELVKFGPLNLSLDELSKLWSVLFQVPYILSIAYKAAVVLIEANVTPIALKPVLERDICVTPEVVVP